jgi:hypothetical protein
MNLRHWSIFNGARMAQRSLRHCYRRPKEKPMAHWLRLWFSPNGAPMAQRRTAGGKIPTRWPTQTLPGPDLSLPLRHTDTGVEVRFSGTAFDATTFTTNWGPEAQAFGWTQRELFGLDQPAANYDRLARLDDIGLFWLLRGRPVVGLTATEALMRGHSSAILVYRRQYKPAAEIAKRAAA